MRQHFIVASKLFGLLTALGGLLFLFGAWQNQGLEHWYLFWNLILAWVPFLLSFWLVELLKTQRWSNWLPLIITAVWIGFLPNTFYMVTDYIHLNDTVRVDQVFDTVMFSIPIWTAFGLGIASMLVVHQELARRQIRFQAWRMMGWLILAVSFAIYIGRFLRWNTWDMITSPGGVLFDISDIILHPLRHGQAFITTLTFFILIMASYIVIRHIIIYRLAPKA